MDPQNTVKTLLIVGLSCFCGYLIYRLVRMNQGVKKLEESLSQADRVTTLSDLPLVAKQRQLEELSRTALNTMSEASLSLASESAHRLFVEALLNEIDYALIVVNREYEVQFCNQAARYIFPSSKPVLGEPLISMCFDHRITDTIDLAHSLSGKTQDQITHRDPHDRNRNRTLVVEAEPLRREHGVGEGSWLLVRDVTQQIETDQIRRDFVANASHEFRTPLSILSGYLEMLDSPNPIDPKELCRYVETMRNHCDRLSRIVDDMLAISKLESSHEMLNLEEFDLAACFDEVIEQLQPVIAVGNGTVTLDLPKEKSERTLLGDRFYWDQIFFNLIENAIKMNAGTGVKVSIRMRHEAPGRLKIQVSDDGVGIPEADISHVFKRFFRVEKSHVKAPNSTKGTGLGLSIVKRAVEAHSGQIQVASIPGSKTTFTILVPTAPSAPKKKHRKKVKGKVSSSN